MVNFSLEGKVALVTGGSYGIGFAIASAYAEAGATICFNGVHPESVEKGIAKYKEKGIDVHGYVCDVTDEEQVKKMISQINEEVGVIDILVNNAGIILRKPMLETGAYRIQGSAPGNDREGTRQDHQRLLYDERARTRDCFCLCGGKGRS